MSTICEVPDTCLEMIERITGALSYFCCQGLGVYDAALTYLTFLGSDRPPVEANARIFAGLHFRSACDDGQKIGIDVANHVLQNSLQPINQSPGQ